jgi:hypothetical protein
MAVALVGSVGAVATSTVGGTASPAWGTGSSRTAGNLLVLVAAVTGINTTLGNPPGWTVVANKAGTSSSTYIFSRIAAGADVAPTTPPVTSGTTNAQLMEFSGASRSSSATRSTGSAGGTSSPQVATNAISDSAPGSLMISAAALVSSAATATMTDTYTNGTAIQTNNAGSAVANHYDFGYSVTTANATPDADSLAFSGTSVTDVAMVVASFSALMPIDHAILFPAYASASPMTGASATWQTAGDLAVVTTNPNTAAVTLTGVASSKTTSWTKVGDYSDATDSEWFSLWTGVVTAAGADTINFTWSGTPPTGGNVYVDELAGGVSNPIWAVVTNSSLRTASATTYNWPSLTSGSASSQAYWGASTAHGTTSAGSTGGFVYSINSASNVCLDGSLATSTAYQPNANQITAGFAFAIGMIVSVTAASFSGVNYAGAAAGLSGGVGSWTNPTNADGAPDSAYATWTAP